MPDIKVSTKADLSGYRQLQNEMSKMIQQAEKYTSLMRSVGQVDAGHAQMAASGGGVAVGGRPSVGHHAPPDSPIPGTAGMPARIGGGGPSYNLATTAGYTQYYENVVAPAMTAIAGTVRGGAGQNLWGVKYAGRPVSTSVQKVGVTSQQIKSWFQGLQSNFSAMERDTQLAYLNAAYSAGSSNVALPSAIKNFYKEYGTGLGAPQAQRLVTETPIAQTPLQRFAQHFTNNASGSGLVGKIVGGIKGGVAGSAIDALAGGGEAGAVAGGLGGAGIGGMLGGPLGAAIAAGVGSILNLVGGTIKQGMQTFSETIPVFSQMSHALDNATNSALGFQQSLQMAGARVAMSPVQSTQVAQTLMQGFGNSLGMRGLTRMVQQAGANALLNGLDPQVQANIMAQAAQLGITNGVGSSMNPSAYNQMFLNMVQQGHMQGRQGALATGLLSVYSGLGSMSPIITSANSTAAQYTAMSATGIQGLQGPAGANILSTMNSSIGSGSGLGGLMSMAAIYQASNGKVTNPWQMRSIMEQGLGAQVGGTTLGAQLTRMVKQMAPGDIFTQAGILSQMTGISENQAVQMLKSGALNAQHVSTVSGQKTRLTISEQNAFARAKMQVLAGKLGALRSLLGNLGAKVAGGSSYVTPTGTAGNPYTGPYAPPSVAKAYQAAASHHVPQALQGEYLMVNAIMQSVATQESSGNPYVINDNSTGKSYSFQTRQQYLTTANQLTAKHHQLALGAFQLENFHKGVTPLSAINPTWSANEALNILLQGKDPRTMNTAQWETALENYSGGTPGYAQKVLTRANNLANGATQVSIAQESIQALGQEIAHYLNALPTH